MNRVRKAFLIRTNQEELIVLSLKELDLIRFPIEDSKANYLAAFWQWIALLEADDYESAVNALYWSKPTTWTGAALKDRITTFFGGDDPWFVVTPNDRLIGVINDSATFSPGWFMAQIPLTTQPSDPKNDEIPLMGLASSFFVRENDGQYVMEHEIFHL